MAAYIWRANYEHVFPFTLGSYSVGALLPAVLYMFRWGQRRGVGRFEKIFSGTTQEKPTIDKVSTQLSGRRAEFEGFETDTTKAILGDLLLTYLLENKRREEGRDKQIQRIFPSHYFASWIDLPKTVANLRGVPETIVALLADQPDGEFVEPGRQDSHYPVGCRIEQNELLKLFAPGGYVEGDYRTSLTSDRFSETVSVGLDQLAAIRLAQACGSAPEKVRGKGQPAPVSNRRPIATRATRIFQEDLIAFLRSYGPIVPRLSLLPMLDTCIGINLSNIYLSSTRMLEVWKAKGRLPDEAEQTPWPLFVDCSLSTDRRLRQLAEHSMDQCRRRLSNLATTLMYLRLLDYEVQHDSGIPKEQLPRQTPVATSWLNLLGDFACGTHEGSRDVHRFFRRKSSELSAALEEEDPDCPALAILRGPTTEAGNGWQLADALRAMMGDQPVEDFHKFLNSCLMLDEPNGIGRGRRIRLRIETAARKTGNVTCIALSNTSLEFLVHRHLRNVGKGFKARELSLPHFIALLRERYGYYVDQAPPDVHVPGELLTRNRQILERRLRDLGLLVGVNDAETMKRLVQRFPAEGDRGFA
jgi:hypothetical protein